MDSPQQARPISAWYITEILNEQLIRTLSGRGWEIREIKSHYKGGGFTPIVDDNDPVGAIERRGADSLTPQIQSIEQVLRPPPEPTLSRNARL